MKDYIIEKKIEQLITVHETRNPYQLAKENGIFILEENLGEVYGYFNTMKRRKFIHINENLDEQERLLTCCHELGHAILHQTALTPALTRKNLVSDMKIEREANYFATKLIIDESHENYNIVTSFEILDYYGLPHSFERFL
jgi:Zn-dependent peptidase ImmA (M78 family)